MDKKQYNNIIDWTLNNEERAQCEDSLTVARVVCTNLGVALPQGDLKQVAEVLATDDYMGWKACTKEEAQASADVGTPAISVSNDRIVVLAATDEEQPMAATATVMTLADGTGVVGDSVAYYSYSGGTTTLDEPDEQPQNRLLVEQIINQWDSSVKYPNTNQSAFTDKAFLQVWCGKPESDFTIAGGGCAICCVASFILHKAGVECNNNNKFKAVEQAVKHATNEEAYFKASCDFEADINGTKVDIRITKCEGQNAFEEAVAAIRAGKKCIIYMENEEEEKSHYVLVDGYDESACDMFNWFLVCDPDGGEQRTLYEAITRRSNKGHSPGTDTFTFRIIE